MLEPHNDICHITWMSTTPTLISTDSGQVTPVEESAFSYRGHHSMNTGQCSITLQKFLLWFLSCLILTGLGGV